LDLPRLASRPASRTPHLPTLLRLGSQLLPITYQLNPCPFHPLNGSKSDQIRVKKMIFFPPYLARFRYPPANRAPNPRPCRLGASTPLLTTTFERQFRPSATSCHPIAVVLNRAESWRWSSRIARSSLVTCHFRVNTFRICTN